VLELARDVVRGQREAQMVGIARDHPAGDVELLELDAGIAAVLHLPVDVDRPELRPQLAGLHPSEVGMLRRRLTDIVRGHVQRMIGGATDLPGQIVVPVDQRRGPEQRTSVGQRPVGRRGLPVGGRWHQDEE
jgi:hypothetical protein